MLELLSNRNAAREVVEPAREGAISGESSQPYRLTGDYGRSNPEGLGVCKMFLRNASDSSCMRLLYLFCCALKASADDQTSS